MIDFVHPVSLIEVEHDPLFTHLIPSVVHVDIAELHSESVLNSYSSHKCLLHLLESSAVQVGNQSEHNEAVFYSGGEAEQVFV